MEKGQLSLCPCGTGRTYAACCKRYHLGEVIENVQDLVRARYCAYALNLPDYIIATTDRASPLFIANYQKWNREIIEVAQNTTFQNLRFLKARVWDDVAVVIFEFEASRNGSSCHFIEKSFFLKREGRWFYRNGLMLDRRQPHLFEIDEAQILHLAYYGDPILRQRALSLGEITEEVKERVQRMIATMDSFDGMGLAAPQVHWGVRLFVLRVPDEPGTPSSEVGKLQVMINPKLGNPSDQMWKGPEGCLSIPSLQADVRRPKEITVEYTNLEGEYVTERVKGWHAKVIMHENDHLNGTLFIDRLEAKERASYEPALLALTRRLFPSYSDLK